MTDCPLPQVASRALVVRVPSRWVRIAEVWFAAAPLPHADLLVARQWREPAWSGHAQPKHTLIVDLAQDEALRLAACSKDTQYQIRRASTKDRLESEFLNAPGPARRAAFADFYDAFAALKELPPCDRGHLRALDEAGGLALSAATQDGQTLVWHSYVVAGTRARLLHSASRHRASADSAFRALTGRANRWLHWRDMALLAQAGCREYDFGGWYAGHSEEARLKINAFKQEFGGTPRCEHDGMAALSWRGRLYLAVRQLRGHTA